jgi:hypothetical protein
MRKNQRPRAPRFSSSYTLPEQELLDEALRDLKCKHAADKPKRNAIERMLVRVTGQLVRHESAEYVREMSEAAE